MKKLLIILSTLLLLIGCNSSDSNEIIKTSFNELNSQEKQLLQELDSNKSFYLYKGDNKYLNLKFNICESSSCKNFNLLIDNKNLNFGINSSNLYIFYPDDTRKFVVTKVDENSFILTNLKQQCQNAIAVNKEDALNLSNGDLPLCTNW